MAKFGWMPTSGARRCLVFAPECLATIAVWWRALLGGNWGAPNDTAFLAMEEYRRGLPDHCLHEFAKLPYYSELVSRLRSILLAGVQPYLHFYLALVKSSANGTRTRSFGLRITQARCASCLLANK